MHIGYTLTQTALALRFGRSATWVRRQGEFVTHHNGNDELETWARAEYSTGRLAYYKLVSRSAQ